MTIHDNYMLNKMRDLGVTTLTREQVFIDGTQEDRATIERGEILWTKVRQYEYSSAEAWEQGGISVKYKVDKKEIK